MSGQRILHYEIVEKLGQGGMGVVYKALDTHLDRFVAMKVLPADKVGDPDRVHRLEKEAKAASALQHANIVTIHDIVESDGCRCIVMEHVDGKTLEALIPKHGLRIGQTLKIAIQIADAVAAAHGKGIVHRDLKPSNVMVRPDGTVKVVDFGLAKLTEPVATSPDAETRTMSAATEAGTVVGTAAYMSPEQAEGKSVDARTDIFSFGAMLYEMVTGRLAFERGSKVETLAAVMHSEPEPLKEAPRDLAKVISRCLRKDPDRRYQSMKDVKVELEDLKEETDSGAVQEETPVRRTGRRGWMLALGGGMAVVAVVGAGLWGVRRGESEVLKLQMTRFTSDPGQTAHPALSADGKLAAYASDRSGEGHLDIYVQHTGGGSPKRLTSHPAEDYDPSFSPDGSRIAFRSERDGGGIYIIDTLGGQERKLVGEGRLPTFSPDGSKIAFHRWTHSEGAFYSPMFVVSPDGGEPKQICPGYVTDNTFAGAGGVSWSPDGKRVLFRGRKLSGPNDLTWWTAAVEGGEPVDAGLPPPSSHLFEVAHPVGWFGGQVYCSRGTLVEGMNLFRIPIIAGVWKLGKEQQQLTTGGSVIRRVSFSQDGRMLISSTTQGVEFWSLPIPRGAEGHPAELSKVTSDATIKGHGSITRDGNSLAYVSFVSWQLPRIEIRVRNLKTGTESVYAPKKPSGGTNPQISPDGTMLAYLDREGGQVGTAVAQVGSLPGRRVCTGCQPISFHPDSRRVLVAEGARKATLIDVETGRRTPVIETGTSSLCYVQFAYVARFSPDGKWLVFSLDATKDRHPTYIAPVREGPTPEAEWIRLEVSGDNSWSPVWSPQGDVIYMMSNRDGHACIWAQRLDPSTKKPLGSQFVVRHFHFPEASDAVWGRQMFLLSSVDKLVVTIGSRTGNLWMAKLEGK